MKRAREGVTHSPLLLKEGWRVAPGWFLSDSAE